MPPPVIYGCLICDEKAIAVVLSDQMQNAPLCSAHWADYSGGPGGLTADEVRKYFADGCIGDEPQPLEHVVMIGGDEKKTDETKGEYQTGSSSSG